MRVTKSRERRGKSPTRIKCEGNIILHHDKSLGVQISQYCAVYNRMEAGVASEPRPFKRLSKRHFLYVAVDQTIRVGRIGKPYKVLPMRKQVHHG